MITFKESGIEGYPCHKCNSSSCIHVSRKPCLNCAVHQHPETKVIHIGTHILCHGCVQEIISLIRNEDTFYGVYRDDVVLVKMGEIEVTNPKMCGVITDIGDKDEH